MYFRNVHLNLYHECYMQGFVVDNDDASVTRSNEYMLDLFERANLTLLYNIKQRNFPKELFEVRMYALKPREPAAGAAAT